MGLIPDFFSQVADSLRERRRDKISEFSTLVRAVVEGRKFDPDDAAQILDVAGKTGEDLEAAVALEKQRDEWRAMLAEEPTVRERLPQLDSEIKRRSDEFAQKVRQLQQEHARELAPLRAERDLWFSKHARLTSVNPRARLVETSAIVGDVKAELGPKSGIKAMVDRLHGLERQERAATGLIGQLRSTLDYPAPKSFLGVPIGRKPKSSVEAEIAAAEANRNSIRAEIAACKSAIEERRQRVAAVESDAIEASGISA